MKIHKGLIKKYQDKIYFYSLITYTIKITKILNIKKLAVLIIFFLF